jgi:hypothetical protein
MQVQVAILLILFISPFLSCKKKDKNKEQYNLSIPKPRLKKILIDLYIAGAAAEQHPSNNKDSLKSVYQKEICEIHKIKVEELEFLLNELHNNHNTNSFLQKEVLDSINFMSSTGYKYQQ